MKRNVIITGATGMIGKGVLLECLDQEIIGNVLVIGRNPVNMKHPKLKELIVQDFSDFTAFEKQLSGYDACFYCLGISAAGLKEDRYHKITYEYTLALATTLLKLNRGMTFNYVSGQGTDATEKSRMMWARVKGKTENDLLKLGFQQAYMFRPGMIIPLKGIKSRTKSYRLMYDYFMWLIRFVKMLSPKSIVTTAQIGQAMINSVIKGYDSKILTPKDIINLSEK